MVKGEESRGSQILLHVEDEATEPVVLILKCAEFVSVTLWNSPPLIPVKQISSFPLRTNLKFRASIWV